MFIPKNTLLIILLSLATSMLFSQGGFRKKYFLQNSLTSICTNAIETPNGDFILMGVTYDTLEGQGTNRLTLIGTDPLGTVLWRKDYGNYKFEYLNSFSKHSTLMESNCFYSSIGVRDSNNMYLSVIIKFNYNGDTLWQKRFYSNQSGVNLYFGGITKGIDGGLLVTGLFVDFNTHEQPGLLLKTDINGNELWRHKINKSSPNVISSVTIKQDSATKKIITTGYQFMGNGGTYGNVMICDSLGNKLLLTTYNNAGGSAFTDLIQLRDKNFLTCGSWFVADSSNNIFKQSLLVKFDINGNVIWTKKYEPIALYNKINYLYELSNEDIVMVGRIGSMDDMKSTSENSFTPVKIQVIKADRYGTIKWKREIGTANNTYQYYHEMVAGMHATKDGGFIIPAVHMNSPNPRPYSIIKVDSTACDTTEEWCRSVILGVEDYNQLTGCNFELFPNPTSEVVNIKVDAPVSKAFNLTISDASGRVLEEIKLEPGSNLQLHTGAYAAGLYFVNTFYEGKIVETRKLVISR